VKNRFQILLSKCKSHRYSLDPDDPADAPPPGKGFELGVTMLKPMGGAAAAAAAASGRGAYTPSSLHYFCMP
jgi:hypothetical protein